MRIGCPREIKKDEYRVGLTPTSVRELAARGHEVMVETNAGLGIGCSDEHYRRAGARTGQSAAEVWACASVGECVDRTRATTGCGGCADVVRRLVEDSPTPVPVG